MKDQNLKDTIDETRELLTLVAEISADGRRMAGELAETVRGVADAQCGAIDARAAELRARLEEIQKKLEAA